MDLCLGEHWISGVVHNPLGTVSYLVDVGEGRAWKPHADHLKVHDLPESESAAPQDADGTNVSIPALEHMTHPKLSHFQSKSLLMM